MDKKVKKRALMSLFVGIISPIAVLTYLIATSKTLGWQLIAGSFLLMFGCWTIFNLCLIKKAFFEETEIYLFKRKDLLFYGLIFNPGIVFIFLGILNIAGQYQLNQIKSVAVIIMILCTNISFVLLIAALVKRRGGETHE